MYSSVHSIFPRHLNSLSLMSYDKAAPNPGSNCNMEHLDQTNNYQVLGQPNLQNEYGRSPKKGISPWARLH